MKSPLCVLGLHNWHKSGSERYCLKCHKYQLQKYNKGTFRFIFQFKWVDSKLPRNHKEF